MSIITQILIIFLYLITTAIIGLYSRKKVVNSQLFLGANLGIMLCVTSGAGEWMGGTSTTGVSEYGYTYGISGAWYTIANGFGIVFLALFFAKLYRSLDKVTVSGIIGKYLGRQAGAVASALLIVVMLIVGASQMVAIGTLGQLFFGLNEAVSITLMGIGIILYTWFGGMLAVGYTNILHMLTMYIGVIIALLSVLTNIGGINELKNNLPNSYFNIMSIGNSKIYSWIIASVLGACTAQAGIQPILAAKDEKIAVKSSFIIALLVAPFGVLTAMLGMAAKIKFPELTNAKLALPQLMLSLDPFAGGMVLASILAAILSTASPIFLASGTLFTKDIYLYFRNETSEKNILRVSRISTLFSGIICIVLAIALYNSAMLLDIVYFAYSIRGSIFIILILGIYWRRITSNGAIIGMIMTMGVGLVWVGIKSTTGVYPIHPEFTETYASVVAAVIFTVIFSLFKRSPNK